MTTIYLINNNSTLNNLIFDVEEEIDTKNEKRILSIEGERESTKLAKDSDLQNVNVIYASPFVGSLATAKYLANALDLEIQINSFIRDILIGNLGNKKIRMLREIQENDFNYKLIGGESYNQVKSRMKKFLNKVLNDNKNKTIAVFTHKVAITCLLSDYCEIGFNLDNRLILNYQEQAIIDGAWDGIKIIEMNFENEEIISIKRKN